MSVDAKLDTSGSLCDILLEENGVVFLILSQCLLPVLQIFLFNPSNYGMIYTYIQTSYYLFQILDSKL